MRRVLTLIWVELEAACSNKSGKGKSDKGGTEDVYLWKFQVGIPYHVQSAYAGYAY